MWEKVRSGTKPKLGQYSQDKLNSSFSYVCYFQAPRKHFWVSFYQKSTKKNINFENPIAY